MNPQYSMNRNNEKNISRLFLVSQTDITDKKYRYFKTFSFEKNEMIYGFYLFDTYTILKNHKPLFYLPVRKGLSWFFSIGMWSASLFSGKERKLYGRVRPYQSKAAWKQLFHLAAQNKSYNRHLFLLENFQLSEEYLQKHLQGDKEKVDIIIYSDQNGKVVGLYLKKDICVEVNLYSQDAQKLFSLLQKDYAVTLEENFIVHYHEQDLALSLWCMEKESSADNPTKVNNTTLQGYHAKVSFLSQLLKTPEEELDENLKRKQYSTNLKSSIRNIF